MRNPRLIIGAIVLTCFLNGCSATTGDNITLAMASIVKSLVPVGVPVLASILDGAQATAGIAEMGVGAIFMRPDWIANGGRSITLAGVSLIGTPVYLAVDSLVDKTKPRHFHGNWCGPGYPPAERTVDPPVVDLLDALCKAHDECYGQVEIGIGSFAKCDATLAERLSSETMGLSNKLQNTDALTVIKIRTYYGAGTRILPMFQRLRMVPSEIRSCWRGLPTNDPTDNIPLC